MQDKALPPSRGRNRSELTLAEADKLLGAMMPEILAVGLLAGAAVFTGGLIWHRTADQLEFLGAALGAISIAVSIWRHDVVWVKYRRAKDPSGHEVAGIVIVFHSPVPKEIAAPVLILAAVPFVLAATSTGIGTAFASILGAPLTVLDAKDLALGILPGIGIVAVMLVVLAVIIWTTGRAAYNLGTLAARRPRPRPGPDAALFFGGLAVLGVVMLAVYLIFRYHHVVFGAAVAPFRAIWGWFT